MPQLRTIEVDWEIYRAIEAERRSFDEPQFIALRRLLRLPAVEVEPNDRAVQGRPWTSQGVIVPHGTPARMEYLRGAQIYEGTFVDGKLVVNGRSFTDLSAAADALAVTKKGTRTSLNGWKYWQVKLPGEADWVLMARLRYLAEQAARKAK